MTTITDASPFVFLATDHVAVANGFIAHLERFAAQERDVSWQDAPKEISAWYDTLHSERLFRRAMEELLDEGRVRVERLDGGGNRLVVAKR